MAISNTSICNMSLTKIGAKRINNLEDTTEGTISAIQCRLHFEQTRDSLLRTCWWRFASGRASLSQDTESPDFEWDNQFLLPNDFLRLKAVYDDVSPNNESNYSYTIEGDLLLTNEGTVDIRYVKKVTDPAEFDPLFVEVFVTALAVKLVMPLSQDRLLYRELQEELARTMARVRVVDLTETNTVGRNDRSTWIDAKQAYPVDSRLGS